MFWKRKRQNAEKTQQSAAERRAEAKVISELVASQYLSESHNGRYARAVIWTVVIGLVAFLYWAALTPVYEIVSGNGSIRPQGLSTRIEHRDGGIISDISVAEGDRVRVGDIIARLDDSDLQAELQKLQAGLDGLEQRIARHKLLLSLDLSVAASETMSVEQAAMGATFKEELTYRMAQLDTMRAQREVARTHRTALEAQLRTTQEELQILQGQLNRYEQASSRDVIPLARREDLRREVLRLDGNVGQIVGEIAVQTATILQMRSQEVEVISQYRREASLKLDEALEERIATMQSILQVEDRLMRNVLHAPVSGVVQALSVQNEGEVLGAGEIFAEIIPEDTRAFAEIEIAADRISGVQVGRAASIKVLTYDFTRFGDIPAVVERISPSSFTKQSGEVVFRVQLSFEDGQFAQSATTGSPAHPISPGMTVVADIKSERRTILSFLLKPIRVIADRAFTEA